jgi:glycosyltransferase involved in cell wall biosynthesis
MQRPVPILMLVRTLDTGGIERDVSKLARHLDRSRFTPHVMSLYAGGLRWQEIAAAGIPLLHLPVSSFRSWATVRSAHRLRRYIKDNGIRLLHAFDAPTDIFGIPLARLFGVPVTVSSQLWVHDLESRRHEPLLLWAHRLASAIYVNCHAVEKHLIEKRGLPPDRIRVCHNGVETDVFHPEPRNRRNGQDLVIGTVSVLRPEKGLPVLLEAFARVRQSHPRIRLLIVGSGPMLGKLELRSRELGIADSCRFQPAVANVADFLRSMDIFALPSLSEAFSNALLEAMACGCCPLGSRVGGTPELIEDGERGLLCDAGSAEDLAAKLARVVDDDALRERLATRAADFARGLDIRGIALQLGGIYDALLERVGEGTMA